MTGQFLGNSLWHLIKQSDTVTKTILLLLLVMSISCWAIFLYKLIMIRMKQKQLQHALDYLSHVQAFDGLLSGANRFSRTLPGLLLSRSIVACKQVCGKQDTPLQQTMSERDHERLETQIAESVDELMSQEESYMPVLAVCYEASPLIGLFGTVWGLIHAFVRIGELQTADIATVAPGIAEALITTLAGLMVAIPALVMYQYLVNKMRTVERQLCTAADQVALIMHSSLVRG